MTSMLTCVPSIVVVRVGSEFMMSPFKLHVIDKGLSPFLTTQVSCANSPWFIGLSPKLKGTISGSSVNKTNPVSVPVFTID